MASWRSRATRLAQVQVPKQKNCRINWEVLDASRAFIGKQMTAEIIDLDIFLIYWDVVIFSFCMICQMIIVLDLRRQHLGPLLEHLIQQ